MARRLSNIRRAVLFTLVLAAAAGAQSAAERDQSREIFNEIGNILRDLRDITGFKIHHSVTAEIITRDKVKEFLEKRMKDVATPEGFRRNPRLVWQFYNARRAKAAAVEPNPGHFALAKLEERLAQEWREAHYIAPRVNERWDFPDDELGDDDYGALSRSVAGATGD